MPTRKLLAIVPLLLAIGITTVGARIITTYYEEISLQDVKEHPENYIGEREAIFTVFNVTVIPDSSKLPEEKYYLVHIRDSYLYDVSFVISEDDYVEYHAYVEKQGLFKLVGKIGPGLMHPSDRLITNILTNKAADPYYLEYYTVYITLSSGEPESARPRILGDVNSDGVVDIFDVVLAAMAFGSTPDDSNWNIATDLKNDDVTDIFDIVLLAQNFGSTA